MHWMASLKWLDCVLFSNFWHCIVPCIDPALCMLTPGGPFVGHLYSGFLQYIRSSPRADISPNGNMTP